MTDQQIKAASLKHEKEASLREHQERKRSNLANEAIGRTNAAANVAKAFTSPFKFKLNHIEWYAHNIDSLKAVATLPYVTLQGGNYLKDPDAEIEIGIGGWNVIRYVDTLPVLSDNAVDASSPANLLSQNVFAHLRSKVSGNIGFESADYFMYIMSIGSCYALYAYLCNIIKLLNYNPKDSLIKAKDIINGLGLDWASLNANKLYFTAIVNELGSVISNFALPRDFDYFKRKIWLTSNIFSEESKELGNKYIFRPEGFMRYGSGVLDFVPFGSLEGGTTNNWGIDQVEAYISTFVTMMSSNSAWIAMSGQTQRAYGDEIFTFPSISITDPISIVEDLDILNQIKGAVVAPHPLTLTITQITDPDSPNYGVIYQGTTEDGLNYVKGQVVKSLIASNADVNGKDPTYSIYSPEDEVTYEDITRSTRLMSVYTISLKETENSNHWSVVYKSVGTELVVGLDLIRYTREYTADDSKVVKFSVEVPVNASRADENLFNIFNLSTVQLGDFAAEWMFRVVQMTNDMKFCPKFKNYLVFSNGAGMKQYSSFMIPSAITHRIVTVGDGDLNKINRVACNSLFGVYDNLKPTGFKSNKGHK